MDGKMMRNDTQIQTVMTDYESYAATVEVHVDVRVVYVCTLWCI